MKMIRLTRNALRGLARHKTRSFLMMLGLVIGVASLTMVVAAGAGAKKKVMAQIETHGLATIMVRPGSGSQRGAPGPDRTLVSLTAEDAEAIIEQVAHVSRVSPVQNKGGVDVKYGNNGITTMVFGVTPNWASVREWEIESGAFISDEDVSSLARVCVVGQTVLQELFGGVDPVGEAIRLGTVNCTVKGVFKTKGASIGGGDRDNRIVVPISTASRRLINQTHLNQIMVEVDDLSEIETVAENVRSLLRERHRLLLADPDDFSLRLPTDMIARATSVSGTLTLMLGLVSGVSLLVGGIVIMNLMLISVSERKGEIGLRKAVGARSRDILTQFVVESLAVALCGGTLGLIAGFLGASIMVLLTDTPAAVSWQAFALAFGFAFAVGMVFGVQPARRAAQLDPVEALR